MKQKSYLNKIKAALREAASPEQARVLGRFFKTGPGEYGEGDVFLGIRVPVLRTIAAQYTTLPLKDTLALLRSDAHEERLTALLIMIARFKKGLASERRRIYELYLQNRRYVNNWDLVDLSAPAILGGWLVDKDRQPLYVLACSPDLWSRRMAIVATHFFIRRGEFSDTLKICRLLLGDREDLIHKAAGWMLREVGKRDMRVEERFLEKYGRQMPRTMLRYAIEKFPPSRRNELMQR